MGRIKRAKEVYKAECIVDSINKTLSFYEQYGEDRGAYFIEDLNLRKLTGELTSYDFYTQIKPIGKNGLTIGTVNGGVDILENHSYSPEKQIADLERRTLHRAGGLENEWTHNINLTK